MIELVIGLIIGLIIGWSVNKPKFFDNVVGYIKNKLNWS